MDMKRRTAQNGFTIVELLIVIVIIGILAVLAIGAFSRSQDQARAASVQSDLKSSAKQLEQAKAETGTYPTTGSGLPASPNTAYQYAYDATADTFCLTGTNGSQSFKVTTGALTPVSGGCPGHGVGGVAPITNLITNPTSETTGYALNSGGGCTSARSTAQAQGGTYSTLLTKTTNYCFHRANSTPATPGQVFMFSAWVYSSNATILFVPRGTGVSYSSISKTVPVNTWTRVSQVYTVPAGASSYYIDVGWEAGTAPSGATMYIDNIMFTEGNTLYNYADGSSANWIWNGAAHGATSTGPPL
ncbi:prepilin-type N-terminal cleavage/methylation domain-containing protein [Candidatus Saccharibacteria bacterium]|nr:prepilin-type N-terminal cleavage/methylation domain-containing protein [Candidatus Saccharibacteria bacterium]